MLGSLEDAVSLTMKFGIVYRHFTATTLFALGRGTMVVTFTPIELLWSRERCCPSALTETGTSRKIFKKHPVVREFTATITP